MKPIVCTRFLFQILTALSMFLVLGTLGAWETGGIGFGECLLQLVMFSLLGIICAKKARRRIRRCIHTYHRVPVSAAVRQRHTTAAHAA